MDDQAEITRKREAARRARRLASHFPDPADRDRALAYASELEAQADALEHRRVREDLGLGKRTCGNVETCTTCRAP